MNIKLDTPFNVYERCLVQVDNEWQDGIIDRVDYHISITGISVSKTTKYAVACTKQSAWDCPRHVVVTGKELRKKKIKEEA